MDLSDASVERNYVPTSECVSKAREWRILGVHPRTTFQTASGANPSFSELLLLVRLPGGTHFRCLHARPQDRYG